MNESESVHSIEEVRSFYDNEPEQEWARLAEHPVEFEINRAYLDRYIKPGDRVLDCGGGPGRYSLYLAQRGCEVTLVDLSEGNIALARRKFAEAGAVVQALVGDARDIAALVPGEYDHVLLMGPLYHLLEEADRLRAVEGCLSLLKPGGMLYAAFISLYSGMIFGLRDCPEVFPSEQEAAYTNCLACDEAYAGAAFTQAYFARIKDVPPFFERFPLKQLHLLGSEGVLAPFDRQFLAQPPEMRQFLLDLSLRLCEREELLSYAEHLLYIGQKQA